MIQASSLRPGMCILHAGDVCRVMSATHRTPGNLRAFVQVRMRNLRTGNSFDQRFSATESVERAILDTAWRLLLDSGALDQLGDSRPQLFWQLRWGWAWTILKMSLPVHINRRSEASANLNSWNTRISRRTNAYWSPLKA